MANGLVVEFINQPSCCHEEEQRRGIGSGLLSYVVGYCCIQFPLYDFERKNSQTEYRELHMQSAIMDNG